MRILMVNKFYPPDIGGVETVVAQYAKAATDAGHLVEVLTCHSQRGRSTQVQNDTNGVRVTRCHSLGTVWSMPLSPAFLWHYLLLHRSFDLVHFHEPFPFGTLAALLTFGRPLVITWHSDIVRQWLVRPFVQLLQRLACWKAALITTTSPTLADNSAVLRRFRSKVQVIPLSISVPQDNFGPPRPIAEPYCLYFGRLAPYKGLETLVLALKNVSFGPTKLVIAGDGQLRDWLCRSLIVHSANIHLLVRSISDSEKQALLSHCLFLIFPSSAANEAFGIVQLEAMAHGKAVVNTWLPTGVPWVSLNEETGITVPPNDPASLASAIQRLLDDAAARTSFGAAARQRMQALFSNDRVLPQLLAAYEAAVSDCRVPSALQ